MKIIIQEYENEKSASFENYGNGLVRIEVEIPCSLGVQQISFDIKDLKSALETLERIGQSNDK